MAPPAPALRLLALALFSFMIGQGINARDLKVELQDQKQVDSNGATSVSSDVPYIAGYLTTTTKQHHHPSHHGNTDQPYITGYKTTTPPGTREANQPNYIVGYKSGSHVSNEPYITGYKTTPAGTSEATPVSSDVPYIAGYLTTTTKQHHHPSHHGNTDQAYITGYKTTTPPGTREANQPNYIVGYRSGSQVSNEPYITGYKTTPAGTSEATPVSSDVPYIAGYLTTTTKQHHHPSHHGNTDQAYITGYKTTTPPGTHEANQPNYIVGYRSGSHVSNEPYITGYKTTPAGTSEATPVSSDVPYIAGYLTTTTKQHHHPSHHGNTDQAYITGYKTTTPPGTREANQPNYIAGYKSGSHVSNEPYITGYKTTPPGTSEANQPNSATYRAHSGPGTHDPKDSGEPYITQYGDKPPKESTSAQDSVEQYLAEYGDKTPKESTSDKDSDEQYLTQYGNKTPKESTSTQDSGEQYLTQYGDGTPKTDPKVSTQGHEEKSKNVDHTEAFKTGFFALDDLYAGNVMTLQFPVQEISHFLSRKEANYIPFSSSQLPSVLQLFSIPEDSPKAKSMRGTLGQCEGEPITGERKICATSLESMLEFVDSVIGSNTEYDLLTTSHPSPSGSPLQKYTILEVSQDIDAPKWAACHPLPYSYAVYYCHYISTGTKVFKVSLGGENGDRVEALGVCHLDTSDWTPSHIIFKQLGIEAGKAPVCHFFPIKHLMWVAKPSKATM